MRYSSLKCYRQIKEEGLLSKRRQEVWEALVEHGPHTAGELHSLMKTSKMSRNHVVARLGELRDLGVARELPDMRLCGVTGRTCLVFDVVDTLPGKIERQTSFQKMKILETQLAMANERIASLEAENARLKANPQLSLF